MRRAWITGGDGFVGRYLVAELENQGWRIIIFDMKAGDDIRDFEAVRNSLDAYRPDVIFHLAAQAYVPESFANPSRTFEVNTLGSLNILEAVRQLGLKTTIHLAGTSEEYGDGTPSETAMLEPKSPYAVSKASMDQLGQTYAKAYGLPVVVTRAFNHTGAGRGEQYAESSFAKQVAEIEAGIGDLLEHGNLESVRNYTDVRDIVKAYILAAELPSGVYNICSEQNVTMEQVLSTLTSLAKVEIPTEVNRALYRPSDFSFQEPSCTKFTSLTHWRIEYTLEETLQNILNYWREKLNPGEIYLEIDRVRA